MIRTIRNALVCGLTVLALLALLYPIYQSRFSDRQALARTGSDTLTTDADGRATVSPVPSTAPTPPSTGVHKAAGFSPNSVAKASPRPPAQSSSPRDSASVRPDHVVIVVEENHSYREIAGNVNATYINHLMKIGANLANHYAVEHPSQPNYIDLFSGSNQGVTDDKPSHKLDGDNLAAELIKHGYTFGGYSEGLPKTGYAGPYDLKTSYARKHNPWVDFNNVKAAANMPFSSFPKDYAELPTVSFVIPNMKHDIHDGTIKQADDWLRKKLSGYVEWADKHNSLLILTWDEDDLSARNKIPTVLLGPMVKSQTYKEKTNHYSVLRTVEELYGLPYLGESKNAKPLRVWKD